MSEVKERNQIEEQYKWNLKTMFESDLQWEEELAKTDSLGERIVEFAGKLNTAENIAEYFRCYFDGARVLSQLYNYASLRQSEDTRDSKPNSMVSRIFGKYVQMESECSFAIPEILANSNEKLDEFVNAEIMKPYRVFLEDVIRNKAHTLSGQEERIISMYSEALNGASEAADMLMDADMTFDDIRDKDGNTLPLSSANYIPYQMSDDRVLRENAFHSFYKSFKQYIHTLAATYGSAVTSATTTAKLRKFDSSREMSLFSNNIPVSVYDNLVETVHKNMDLMYRYVDLRKKILGIDELHYYDLYAPLSATVDRKFTYEEAQQLVLEAVKPLGQEYVKNVQKAFDERWIDVYPNVGKTSGAYSSGTFDSNPFILLNFNGSLDSVSTLAHEMGHSQHSWLTNHTQPYQYSDYSLFVAEVASTVNENLLIDQLLAKCTDPKERLALLNEYLEGFKGTVYRQTMFAEFEMKAHQLKEQGLSLDSESLNNIYNELIKLYFGKELVIDDEVQYEWARIPHFYRPFYVYVYATGYCSAVALSEGIIHEGEPAAKKYREFLSMGSSQYPLDELKHGGVDLNTPEPIERALKKFEAILKDAEETYEKIING